MKPIYSQSFDFLSDTITPVSTYLNLRDVFKSVSLFESSDYNSAQNSRSFIVANPLVSVQINNKTMEVMENNQLTSVSFESIHEFEDLIKTYDFKNESLHASNGFFGYFSFDSVQLFENISFNSPTDYTDIPEVIFSLFEYVIVFDNFSNKAKVIQNSFNNSFNFDSVLVDIFKTNSLNSRFETIGDINASVTEDEFLNMVKVAKENVKLGEVFQLVISRRFQQAYKGDDFEIYRQLRALNPSPYMFYFDMGKAKLLGTSPEAQLKITDKMAEIHPIAGTIRRTDNETENDRRVHELINNPKENAEHVMLVDLARNDLNRSCKDVKVDTYKQIQTFSHVIHMVSKVSGQLNESTNSVDTFGASFPAGTLSGAPKYRAMELIDELEPKKRGFYGGAIGQLAPNGDLNMAIVIRSCLTYQNQLYYQAGAGIVMDSVPELELKEVYNKIKAVQQAIELAKTDKNENITHR